MEYSIEPIAYIDNDYIDKFGIPRQSGIDSESISKIIFNKKYRDDNSLRGLEAYSHVWILWIFSKTKSDKDWSPTVRPPRLGGNKRMGVFSTRSPYHPNRIGLSCVKILSIEKTKEFGTVINVSGADLLCGTPIIDIKPYLTFTDSHPDAKCGFADEVLLDNLYVVFETDVSQIPEDKLASITEMLKQDPHPKYQNNNSRVYSMDYSHYNIKFSVDGKNVTVKEIVDKTNGSEK